MYILAIIAIFLLVYFMSVFSTYGVQNIMNYIDVFSLLALLLITIPVLMSARLLKDFNKAFAITLGKKPVEHLITLKRAKEAVDLARKTMLYSGLFVGIFSSIIVLNDPKMPSNIWTSNISVSWLSALYAVGFNLLLLPISSRLELKITEFMHRE